MIVLLLLCAFGLSSPLKPVEMTYRTVGGRDLKAFVFNPLRRGPARPAILLFHGGG